MSKPNDKALPMEKRAGAKKAPSSDRAPSPSGASLAPQEWSDICPFCRMPVEVESHYDTFDKRFYMIDCANKDCGARMYSERELCGDHGDAERANLCARWSRHHV